VVCRLIAVAHPRLKFYCGANGTCGQTVEDRHGMPPGGFGKLAGARGSPPGRNAYPARKGGKTSTLRVRSFTRLASGGKRGNDSNRAQHLGQRQKWRITCRSKCSVRSGAINSLPHWTQHIPNREPALNAITYHTPVISIPPVSVVRARERFMMLNAAAHFAVSPILRQNAFCLSY
jgi:hypothetical protein